MIRGGNRLKTDLLTIPNVGKNTKQSLQNIGITCVEELRGQNPKELYLKDCSIKGYQVDKCQLYLFRMLVYYVEHIEHEEEKLKWWYWKEHEYHEEKCYLNEKEERRRRNEQQK